MDGDGQEVEVMYSVFVADLYTDIAERGCHVSHHVERNRERPALLQKLHNALHVHFTDETITSDDNLLRARSNSLDADQIFHFNNHLCDLMELQFRRQILCNQLKLFGVAEYDGIPTDISGICCIL